MVCLALCFGRQPVFIPLRETCEAGGIGGSARPIGLCFVPTGIAGVNGITRWCILHEEKDEKIPPLLPIKLLKALDAVVEPAKKRMTLREANAWTELEELPSGHQTTSLMHFDDGEWQLPASLEKDWLNSSSEDPFDFDGPRDKAAFIPDDSRLDVHQLVEKWEEFVALDELEKLSNVAPRRAPDPAQAEICYWLGTTADQINKGQVATSNFSVELSKSGDKTSPSTQWPKDEWTKRQWLLDSDPS